jgi:hypothetical protein
MLGEAERTSGVMGRTERCANQLLLDAPSLWLG